MERLPAPATNATPHHSGNISRGQNRTNALIHDRTAAATIIIEYIEI